ncbi:hypothetical protein D1007_15001 [Hordeum vulgare]|nr:hypothetical protein D1007_15001 [Hordeum vulgare]
MLVIPPKFVEVMKEWLAVKLPHVVKLSANKWCKFLVHVLNFEGRMVLGRGWQYFCRRHMIVPGDLVMLRIFDLGLKCDGKTIIFE